MLTSPKRCIVFDLDGTLIDSIKDVEYCINLALTTMGLPPLNKAAIQTLIGPDLEEQLGKVVNNEAFKFSEFIAHYVSFYTQNSVRTTTLYPHVSRVLSDIKSHGCYCYILTNKPQDQAEVILKHLGIHHYFSKIMGVDTYAKPKPSPYALHQLQDEYGFNQKEMIMIGDTEVDIKTAHAANIESIGVTYGYRTQNELKKEAPTALIDNLSSLLKTVSFHKRVTH